MDYFIAALGVFILGNLIYLERTIGGMKQDIKHIKERICSKKKGGK
jgi:hypothetical protein